MDIQERDQITRFLQELRQAQVSAKDPEADQLIREACQQQPDAHYLLTQRCLLMDQALKNLQAENARLQSALSNTPGTSARFLNSNDWGNAPASLPQTRPAASFAPPGPAPQPLQPQPAQPAASAWGSGMLGTVATTAAGVVAGSFLFQGIEHMMGNRHNTQQSSDDHNRSQLADTPAENHVADNAYDSGDSDNDFASLIPGDDDLDAV
ncbi:MAG: DUF2076 domain-containing protein [Betaproteobacteria bacterium]